MIGTADVMSPLQNINKTFEPPAVEMHPSYKQ